MTKNQSNTPALPPRNPDDRKKIDAWASAALEPEMGATFLSAYFSVGVGEPTEAGLRDLLAELRSTMRRVNDGDLTFMEQMLVGQAMALQTMFVSLGRSAQLQKRPSDLAALLSLALKCQAQGRATIDSLVNLKYPRTTVIAKQANVNNGGQQQVNNAALPIPTRAYVRKAESEQNKLLEQNHGQPGSGLDTRAATRRTRGNSTLEAVGAIHRPQEPRGEGRGGA